MPTLHLVVGPVGAGKSTFALALARQHNAVRLTLDDWMTRLFSPDRPDSGVISWYVERRDRCLEQIWRLAQAIAQTGTDVVLEVGLIRRNERLRFYQRVDATGLPLDIHVIDADRDVRRERVMARNRQQGETFSMVVPPDFFELASDMWEPPDEAEQALRPMRFVDTSR